jgi:NAD(P)-dependent dehydrogenase (short-subunit alcohol dehydrogenase family)
MCLNPGPMTSAASQPRRAVVIGNSDGIGLALTRRLLADGWSVAGLSRSDVDAEDDRYAHQVVDVTSAGFRAALAGCLDRLEGVDLCVYAAGIGELLDVSDLGPQTSTLEVNLLGAARTVEVVAPRMTAAGRGHIIGVSSLADALPSGDAPAYSASKAGLSTYLRGLALALRPHGVAVTTVRLGFVDTKMAKSPTTPLKMSPQQATDVILRAVRTRQAVITRPRRMAWAVRAVAAVTTLRLRFAGGSSSE